jgi:hypothetical protein
MDFDSIQQNKVPSVSTPVPIHLKVFDSRVFNLPHLVCLSAGKLSGCGSAAAWNV